jgi:hypothetical protein
MTLHTTLGTDMCLAVFWIHLDPHVCIYIAFSLLDPDLDPYWECGSGSMLGMRIRIRNQEQGYWPKLANQPDFQHLKMVFVPRYMFYGILPKQSIFYMSKSISLWWQSLTRIWIRIRIDVASWIWIRIEVKSWIRIRIETNADPNTEVFSPTPPDSLKLLSLEVEHW